VLQLSSVRTTVRRRPWISAGVAGVVLLGAGGGTWWAMSGSSAADPNAPTTRLVAAALGTVRQSVTSTGTIEPADQDSVQFAASGRVTSVHVAVGDTVKRGDVLGTIDSAALAATLAEAKASLASDQAKVSADQTAGADDTQLQADEAALC
jgi:multidrug efflux pump subunit AcrA (membrane-fusion protein)